MPTWTVLGLRPCAYGERALEGPANFTDRAQSRNIEAGVLVDDRRFAEELTRQFHDAVGAGLFVAA